MWVDKTGWRHPEDAYDPDTWAEDPGNRDRVDWEATRECRLEQEAKMFGGDHEAM